MDNFDVIEHKVPAAHLREFPRATANSEEDVLYLAVKQYIPKNNRSPEPGDVTLIAAHAVGFNKELYEPLWEDLASRSEAQGWRIRSIWVADTAWHAASYALNETVIGNDPGWYDHPRDLMNLINLKRSEMPRPIIGIGHSMGGCQIAKLALDHPSLFTTIILIDPVIQTKSAEITPGEKSNAAKQSTFRRDLWPSRDQAKTSFLRSPFYKIWDPRVLDRWVRFGLRDCPNPQHPDANPPQVSLSTPPAQEVWSFLRPNYEGYGEDGKPINRATHPDIDPRVPNQFPFYRSEPIAVHARLPELRPSCLYVFGELSFIADAARNLQKTVMTGIGVGGSGGKAEGQVKDVTFEGVGHLIPMEVPGKTAEAIAEWVGERLVVYGEQRRRLEEWWARPLGEKQRVDEMWIKHMGGGPKKVGSSSKI
ncbi:uncharacterized protein MYCFIDRAFT_154218 [Pseudocercospora fijiensis CIRAD86]|uniref:AB hydrolase-1 domain-containing protein n=1 Tax=Pseudocercospora fijiensis (strain CIRAD86) TaxID=383855 RepID=M3AGL4_PSEFD|nr:uncharacterized protein MYCFIDRAFT_154218 [Pseudocercospora fijiensis CIRAD86]EME83706.1 hypothetical protein MYCFIDRAFT_154218 [Pseudocercospora fijiensis CIRAD86]